MEKPIYPDYIITRLDKDFVQIESYIRKWFNGKVLETLFWIYF